ncbi:hypothetical protein IAR55_005915 [Kwoniella newhampshirensis]|uniref:DUF676 domain-containing protein n=1 Tax=Kwoniella newhampshirensis TaxID=1651941 RepID=A0AAW0YVT4_9TREE
MSVSQAHLIVLIHGLWEELETTWHGTRTDQEVSGAFEDPTVITELEKGVEKVVIMVAGGMTSQLTYDGVDVCASRVAWEVDQKVAALESQGDRVVKFSVMGYSLGGLVWDSALHINDNTTPYPTAAIEIVDHFVQWEEQGIEVDADEAGVIRTCRKLKQEKKVANKKLTSYIGTLPPVLRYRFPYNYELAHTSSTGAQSPIPSASGLSIQGLRDAIRRIERELESDLIESADTPDVFTVVKMPIQPQEVTIKVRPKDSQLRMALWLNALPLKKYVTWWPEIANAHATIIVR